MVELVLNVFVVGSKRKFGEEDSQLMEKRLRVFEVILVEV